MQEWPPWWDYEIVFSPHCFDRMQERGFTEIDVRAMLDDAESYRPSATSGRYLVAALYEGNRWESIE